jgi:hypothetical protein
MDCIAPASFTHTRCRITHAYTVGEITNPKDENPDKTQIPNATDSSTSGQVRDWEIENCLEFGSWDL